MKTKLRQCLMPSLLSLAVVGFSTPVMAEDVRPGPQIVQETCAVCHQKQDDEKLSRISFQRKTPEGWLMTVVRMQQAHGLEISNAERRSVVKYLADTQGLAPKETEGVRYALERRLNTQESFREEPLGEMCARCHSGARFALQRRPAGEWEKLINFHLGQWPSLEYQALSRDRDWFDIATKQTAPEIAKRFPFESVDWDKWKKDKPASDSLKGTWSFSGHYTGKGEVRGTMSVEPTTNDEFKVQVTGQYADGKPFNGEGTAIVYNGYEWRANITIDGVVMRQVLSAVNGEMKGRMFERQRDERGLDFVGAQQGQQRILAVQPAYVKAGSEAVITLVGSGLSGTPSFAKGIEVVKVESASDTQMQVRVKVAATAELGINEVAVGKAKGASLAVYNSVESIKVVPEYSIARVGGNGGAVEKVEGRFDAEAWAVNAKGKPYRIGVMPATWSVDAWDEKAVRDQDLRFAGTMDAATGVFTPNGAGPNPERKMMASNVGNLKVIAKVEQDGKTHEAQSHMVVTVQRWNLPPIP
ncbi:quinohemoprotein amine dehydrogenase subunit alpha [Pseudomonas sp. F1_0610]|uniref:quinohemoprotein amine dehydrogenase subunit alpha n=1 Tax=Pseudomonas sp. F1_0610 TaxID=3114284 RepID=UPI0039C0ACC6